MREAPAVDHPEENPASPYPLTVHALTEFIFCPRAGLLAVETLSQEEPREDWSALRFFLPYTEEELTRSLGRNFTTLWLLLAVAAVALGGGGYGLVFGDNLVMVGAAVVLLLLFRPTQRTVAAIQVLVQLRAALQSRTGRTPDIEAVDSQPVDWWDMLADDWTSIQNREAYRDQQQGLSGTPWRVLRKGDVSLPVFKLVHADPDDPQVFPQHVVRIVAYCRLIEECERRKSPCGILLFGNSYRGVTVPNTSVARAGMDEALAQARRVVAAEEGEGEATPAPAAELCRGCPWGRPREYRQDVTELRCHGELVPAFGKVARNSRLYHSPCGDRFTWIPQHEDALRLAIV